MTPLGRQRVIEILGGAVLVVLFILLILQSWGMLLHPIIDTGRDLYIPEKIADGGFKLYRDIEYLYPPLTPYLLAAVVAVFGSNLTVMTGVGIVLSTLIASMLYLLGRHWSGWMGGWLLAFLFITVHATGPTGYSFNFIFPYAHAAVFGFLFLLLFLHALMRYAVEEGHTGWLLLALVAGSAAGWTKIEYAATFLAVAAASVLVRRPAIAPLLLAAVANLALLGALTWYFADAPPERHWLTMNVLPQSLLTGDIATGYYDRLQGLDQPFRNLKISLLGATLIAGSVACIAGMERFRKAKKQPLLVASFVVFIMLQVALSQEFLFYRGWTILQWLLIPIAIRERKQSPLLLPLLLSILLGARILLRLEPTLYGFLYAIPAAIVFVYLLFSDLPRRGIYSRRMALAWLPLIMLFGAESVVQQRQVYRAGPETLVTTTRGAFRDRQDGRAAMLDDLFTTLEHRRPESMVVVPEGLTINWLADVDTSIPYHTFNPAELTPDRARETVIPAIETDPPEVVLLIRRDYPEYGFVGIGVDYGHDLIRRIQCLYEPSLYRESPRFFMLMMERKPEKKCP